MTPAEKALFDKYGVSPDTHDLDLKTLKFRPKRGVTPENGGAVKSPSPGQTAATTATTPRPLGPGGVFLQELAHGAIPAVASAAGGGAGIVAGAPLGPVAQVAGGVGGAVLAGLGANYAQEALGPVVFPNAYPKWQAQRKANEAAYPKTAFAGQLASGLFGNKLSMGNNLRAARALLQLGQMSDAARNTLIQQGVNVGAGAGMQQVSDLIEGRGFQPGRALSAGAANVALGAPRSLPALPGKMIGARGNPAMKKAADNLTAELDPADFDIVVGANNTTGGPKVQPVPDSITSLRQQIKDTLSPETTRRATLVTAKNFEDTVPEGLFYIDTQYGRVLFNPNKVRVEEVQTLMNQPGLKEFPAELLGMSKSEKPASGDAVVVGKKGPAETTAEVVDTKNPADVANATAAAKAASPGAEVTVESPSEVILGRKLASADEATVDADAELRAQEDALASQQQRAEDYEKARAEERLASEREGRAAESARIVKEFPRRFGAGMRGRLAQPEQRPAVTPENLQPIEAPQDTVPLTEGEVIQDEFDKGKRFQPAEDDVDDFNDLTGELEGVETLTPEDTVVTPPGKPPVIPSAKTTTEPTAPTGQKLKQPSPTVSQAWYDFWRKTGLKKFLANTTQQPAIVGDDKLRKRGSSLYSTRELEIDPVLATDDTQPHEIGHIFFEDVKNYGTAGEKRFRQKLFDAFKTVDDRVGEEGAIQAIGEQLAGDAKIPQGPLTGIVQDAIDFMRYKLGGRDAQMLKRLGANMMRRGASSRQMGVEPTYGPGLTGAAKYQPVDNEPPSYRKAYNPRPGLTASPIEILMRAPDKDFSDAGSAINTASHLAREYAAKYGQPVDAALAKLSKKEQGEFIDYMHDAFNTRNADIPPHFTPDQIAAAQAFREAYYALGALSNKLGMRVRNTFGGRRARKLDPLGMPHTISPEVQNILMNEPGTEQWHALVKDFIDYNTERINNWLATNPGKRPKLTPDDIRAILDAKVEFYSGAVTRRPGPMGGDAATRAMRLAQFTRLPRSWLGNNARHLWNSYAVKATKDIAQWEAIERDPRLRALLGFNTGDSTDDKSIVPIAGHKTVRQAMEAFAPPLKRDSRGGKAMASLMGTVNNMLTANPSTRGTDLLTTPVKGFTFVGPHKWPALIYHSLKATRNAYKAAKANGLIRPGVQFAENIAGVADMANNAVKHLNQGWSLATGSQALETASRTVAQIMARGTIDTAAPAALRGDKATTRMFRTLGDDWQELLNTQEGRDRLASRLAGHMQGFYTGQNLPRWAADSQATPFVRLMFWSIEQTNNLKRFQLQALKDGDIGPMLSYAIALSVGGTALQNLKEAVLPNKSYIPTDEEIAAAGDKSRANLAQLQRATAILNIMGTFGVYGSLISGTVGKLAGQPMTEWNIPGVEAINTVLQHGGSALAAVKEGEDAWPVFKEMSDNIMRSIVSAYRLAAPMFEDEDTRLNRNNKRDFKVYERLKGEKLPGAFQPIIGYESLDEKKFDKATDIREAAQIARELLMKEAQRRGKSGFDKKVRSLASIGGGREGPNVDDKAALIEYANWLDRTQGPGTGRARIMRLLEKAQMNDTKRRLLQYFK